MVLEVVGCKPTFPGPGKFCVIFWPIPCYLCANSADRKNPDRISVTTQNFHIFLQNSAKEHVKTPKFVNVLQILHFSKFFSSQNLQNPALFQKANSALSMLWSQDSVLSAIKKKWSILHFLQFAVFQTIQFCNTVFPIYSLFMVGGWKQIVRCHSRRRSEGDYCTSVNMLMLLGTHNFPHPYTLP